MNQQNNKIIIAIDGYSSSGKSTMAKVLAKKIGYIYIDTGAMYRAVTLYALDNGMFSGDEIDVERLRDCIDDIKIEFRLNEHTGKPDTYLNGVNVEGDIRGMRVSNKVSLVSAVDFVREHLVKQQQAMGNDKGIVMDGRDIGTTVFPNAELKIFVTASAEIRARRRYDELTAKGEQVDYEEILANVKNRDHIDETRSVSPLRKADDAVVLDNSHMTIEEQDKWLEEVVGRAIEKANSRGVKIEIDSKSGFCFGVVNAIAKAEEELENGETLYCLGDIVHNGREVERLYKRGLVTITHEEFKKLKNVKVLLRAHGEPPTTYQIAKENNIEIIDATCPVVLNLQKKIKNGYNKGKEEGNQVVIYGKKGHAEVLGLVGQTEGNAIVIENVDELNKVDMNKNIVLFSQTTKSLEGFKSVIDDIEAKKDRDTTFVFHDTICRQVSNRIPQLKEFAKQHDLILFVSGKKSSNGKVLFGVCCEENKNSYFIDEPDEITVDILKGAMSVGICGATSTPKWLMEKVADKVKEIVGQADIEQ